MNSTRGRAARRGLFLVLALLTSAPLFADDVDDSRRVYQEALNAYEQKDFAAFLEKVRKASELRPSHPTLLIRYAAALALNGQPEAALTRLERVASMGVVSEIRSADDFAALRGMPRFEAVAKRFESNGRAAGHPRTDFTIEGLGLIPEGMAYDPRSKRWFVSSVRARKIFEIRGGGEVRVLADDFRWGVFGMVFDATRNVIWAATSALPQVEGYKAEDEGKSALLKIDARSGRVLEQIEARDARPHHFNDVTLGPEGTVYVSDGTSPNIYRVHGKSLEPLLQGPFVALQGLAVNGSTMYVADYSKGLFAVDLRTRDTRVLSVPENVTVLGIDGLYVAGPRTLVATQNGVFPNRVVRIRLSADGLSISGAETLAANSPGMGDPTLGVVAGGRFYFNANAQWDLFVEDGTIKDPVRLVDAVVMSVPLH